MVLEWEKQALEDHKNDLFKMLKDEEDAILNKLNENRQRIKEIEEEGIRQLEELK